MSCQDKEKKAVQPEAVKNSVYKASDHPLTDQANNSEQKIKNYIVNTFLQADDLRAIEEKDRKFRFQQIDLNNDGKMETFISFFTPYFCGTGGCSAVLLDNNLKPITKFTVTNPPFYVESAQESRWPIIYLQNNGQWKRLNYKNGKYPSNPSVAEDSKPPETANLTEVLEPSSSTEYTF